MTTPPDAEHFVPLGSWLIRIITWDGLLPTCIWSAPLVIQLLVPNLRGAIELTAVFLPIAAFCVRFFMGQRHIETNGCGRVMRRFQMAALCFGIFALVFIDAIMILTHIMPGPPANLTAEDLIFLGIVYCVYLVPMAFALYPGCMPAGDS